MRNFGHNGPEDFFGVGINAKNSEYHAAMGLCNLKYIEEIKEKRKSQSEYYDEILQKLDIKTPSITPECTFNYAY
jgi:dTDP-4-amino-4,6-dideoxygalactose transaminase